MKIQWYKSKIVKLVAIGSLLLLAFYMYYTPSPSPCECARLSDNAPWTDDYNPLENKHGLSLDTKVRDELVKKDNAYFELSKQCVLKFGRWDKDALENSLSEAGMYRWQKLIQILIFSRTLENAEGECESARL